MRSTRFKKKKESDTEQEDNLQLVNFMVRNEHFGTDILRIKEIDLYEEFSRVPDVPEFIEGFIIIRQEIVPLIDLGRRFYGKAVAVDLDTRIIVATVGSNMVGFIVDSVCRVMTVPKKCITKQPKIMTQIDVDYIQGVVVQDDQRILLVDFDRILSKSKKRELLNLLNEEEKKDLARMLLEDSKRG